MPESQDHYDEENPESQEKPPLTLMPFAELADLLAPKGINLAQELDDHITFMVDHGVIEEDDRENYRKKFETIHVQKEDLEYVPQGWRPLLFVDDDNATPIGAAEEFIIQRGIPLYQGVELDELKKVDHPTKKLTRIWAPSGFSRLIFSPNCMHPTSLNRDAANYDPEEIQEVKRFLEPTQWFQMFARSLQEGIKALNLGNGKAWKDMTSEEKKTILNNSDIDEYLLDGGITSTWCLNWRDVENREVIALALFWDPENREVTVDYHDAMDEVRNDLGCRPILG